MRYFQNGDTMKVIAVEDAPKGNWFEIEQEDYEVALHPLSRPTTGAVDLSTPEPPAVDFWKAVFDEFGLTIAPPNH